MNRARRKQLSEAKKLIGQARDILLAVAEHESGDPADYLETAMDSLDAADEAIDDATMPAK